MTEKPTGSMTAEDQSQQAFFDHEKHPDTDQSDIENQAGILRERTEQGYLRMAEGAIRYSTNIRTTDRSVRLSQSCASMIEADFLLRRGWFRLRLATLARALLSTG